MSLSLCSFILSALLASVALLLDYRLAEPRRFHPLVGFGHWAGWWQQRLNPQAAGSVLSGLASSAAAQRLLGVLAVLLVVAPLFYLLFSALKLVWVFAPWLAALLEAVLLYLCLGGRSLQQHVQAVATALQQQKLAAARQKLSWIVSRETAQLAEAEVAQASIETTLENSSDAIFASLFWFALGGAPLALLHRWLNTLDAMWGYKNRQYRHFGWAAARLDDLMNVIPARLTALCFVLLSRRISDPQGRQRNAAWWCWRTQAQHCASPNGGVVMTAGAGALQRRLSAGGYYHGQWQDKPPMGCGPAADVADIAPALTLVQRALWLFMAFWLGSALVLALAAYLMGSV